MMNSKLSSYLSAFSNRIMIMSNPKNVFRSFLFQGGAGFYPLTPPGELVGGSVSPVWPVTVTRRDCRAPWSPL